MNKEAMEIKLAEIVSGLEGNRPLEAESGDSMEVLAASLSVEGQQVPILVRPVGVGRYQVIQGHRRVAAANRLGWKVIRAFVEEMDDEEAQRRAFAENWARKKVGLYWEAQRVQEMAKRHAMESVASYFGKSVGWVRRRMHVDLEGCRRLGKLLERAGVALSEVHDSNWEMVAELDEEGWKALEGKDVTADWLRSCFGSKGWLSSWVHKCKVSDMPWNGAWYSEMGEELTPECSKCPHLSQEVDGLFPELAGWGVPGWCSHLACQDRKQEYARQAALREVKNLGWKGEVYTDKTIPNGMNAWAKCRQSAKGAVPVAFEGERSGEWGWYRPIKALPKVKEPGNTTADNFVDNTWEKRQAACHKFDELVMQVLKAPIPVVVDDVELPNRVMEVLHSLHAWIRRDAEDGNFDFWSYCQWPLERLAFHALAELTLSRNECAKLREKILELEKEAELEEKQEEKQEDEEDDWDEEDGE